MQLSKRLRAVADMVTKGNTVADIGTDHGYVPIYLVAMGLVPHAIAMDVNRGPLNRADEHIREFHLEDKIETRLSFGLTELKPNEAETVVIAGMGGFLIIDILEEYEGDVSEFKEIVIQAQSDVDEVRKYLEDNGFAIANEKLVYEDEKFYFVIKALPNNDGLIFEGINADDLQREIFYKYGKCLIERKDETLKLYLMKERENYLEIADKLRETESNNSKRRLSEIEDILELNQAALSYFD